MDLEIGITNGDEATGKPFEVACNFTHNPQGRTGLRIQTTIKLTPTFIQEGISVFLITSNMQSEAIY
jgi:hypothetical protein